MSAARLNSRALTVRGTLPQIGSFSLALPLASRVGGCSLGGFVLLGYPGELW